MKNFSNQSIVIMLIGISLFFLVSCSENSPENLKTIPKETNIVSVIDIYSIFKKGKFDEISDLKLFRTMKKEIRSENKKIYKIIDNIIEDPTIAGIDFKTDMFVYYLNELEDEKYTCVSAEITNEEKFTKFIKSILNKFNIEFDIENEKTYKYTIIKKDLVIGWDNDKVLLLIANNYKSRKNLDIGIETLMGLKDKNQITVNDNFNQFYENKKDISIWFSSDFFENSREFKKNGKNFYVDITNNYISSYLNFDKDNISLLTKFSINDEIQKLIDEDNIGDVKFNNQLLNFFPRKTYALARISLNPMSYYNLIEAENDFEKIKSKFKEENDLDLKKFFKSISGNIIYSLFAFENIEYSYMGWGYGFNKDIANKLDEMYKISKAGYLSTDDKELLNQGKTIKCSEYSNRYCINIRNILDNGGNIETAISNDSEINWYEGGWEYGRYIEKTEKTLLPIMGLAFDINGNKIIKKLIKKIPEDEINKHSKYYEFKFDKKYPIYLSFTNDICFITNDKKSIKKFKNGGHTNDNLSASNIASDILNNSFYSFLNLDYDDYPKSIKKKIKNEQNNKEEKIFKIWNEFAKSIEVKQVDESSFEIIFKIKNSENNSLNSIITRIDDNYKFFL